MVLMHACMISGVGLFATMWTQLCINNLRCADVTTLMAESEEELKSLLMKVKEENEKLA